MSADIETIEPLCRYCDAPAMVARTAGARSTRTFRCDAHRDAEDTDTAVASTHPHPAYEHLDFDAELLPAMREAYRLRKLRGGG